MVGVLRGREREGEREREGGFVLLLWTLTGHPNGTGNDTLLEYVNLVNMTKCLITASLPLLHASPYLRSYAYYGPF